MELEEGITQFQAQSVKIKNLADLCLYTPVKVEPSQVTSPVDEWIA